MELEDREEEVISPFARESLNLKGGEVEEAVPSPAAAPLQNQK